MLDPTGAVFYSRFQRLYHAIQLTDFLAYCEAAAVLSRELLTVACPKYTSFYSDDADKRHGVWGRTFGNLQDYGSLFWNCDRCIPNCYGPIALVFDRDIWEICVDVAVTNTSAGDPSYSLQDDRIEAADMRKCYKLEGKYWQLATHGHEVSVGNDRLPLDRVKAVLVEPLNNEILQIVTAAWEKAGLNPAVVRKRNLKPPTTYRSLLFDRLVDWARVMQGDVPSYAELESAVPEELEEWFTTLPTTLHPPLRQWLVYTYCGTIRDFGGR